MASKELRRQLEISRVYGEKHLRDWWAAYLNASPLGEQSE